MSFTTLDRERCRVFLVIYKRNDQVLRRPFIVYNLTCETSIKILKDLDYKIVYSLNESFNTHSIIVEA